MDWGKLFQTAKNVAVMGYYAAIETRAAQAAGSKPAIDELALKLAKKLAKKPE